MVQYRLPDTLSAVGITDPAVLNNAAAFWGERFFASDYLKYDTATPASVDFLRRLYSSGARIVYASGRDLPRQYLGTARSLYELGFPIGIQGTELAMKPTTQTQDDFHFCGAVRGLYSQTHPSHFSSSFRNLISQLPESSTNYW